MPRVVVALLLLLTSVVTGVLVPASVASAPDAEGGRTWVVDAVDDPSSNRWESVDTGTTVVTISVGDTVEWQFDRATQGHDLVSLAPTNPWETAWAEPLEDYRDPGGAVVRRTFTEPGTYRYECSLHGPMMSGTVIVTDVEGNTAPTADPVVEPVSGPAPLVVHATANAADADDDVVAVSWDSGTGGAAAYTDHAMLEYRDPGSYVATLRVSDGRGGLHVEEFPITVTGDAPPDPEPPVEDGSLPAVAALAAPGQGTAPLTVAFSTEVTTTGVLHAYSVGLEAYPDLTGDAALVRRRGQTRTSLRVTGAEPSTSHANVHVHERSCADQLGGAHFRFDDALPFAAANEIWPLFTTDAAGASGPVVVTSPMRAGPKAVSVVVHDPANAARRIGCADLGPSTADLTYSWTFGDGTTGSGADPDHTYASPGAYVATVTVAHGSGAHAGHLSVSDSVQVVVGGGTPPPVPPAQTVDRTPPRISKVGPHRTVRNARPTIRARVRDRDSAVRRTSIVLRVDGRRVSGLRWVARRGQVTWRPRRALTTGRHVVRLVAKDAAGNRTRKTWTFRVR